MYRIAKILLFFLLSIILLTCVESKKIIVQEVVVKQTLKPHFSAPIKSPFKYNVGIDFNIEQTIWYSDSLEYNRRLQEEYTYKRLVSISKDFKLIRIYDFLVAGWESTGALSPEAYAVAKLAKEDHYIEVSIGTSNSIAWYMKQRNIQMFVDTLQNKFGSAINQVKTILIGNEINANGYTEHQISVIMTNFKLALQKNKLNIPVTVSFSSLPNQKGDALSDSLVAAVVKHWDTTWNDNKPFVFIDPYPDGMVGGVAGVFNWQNQVTKYYQSYYPSLQIFVSETGAEGSNSDSTTVLVVDSIFQQLTLQHDSVNKTVPTFIFEAVNEPLKFGSPDQKFMGIYLDSLVPENTRICLKSGINLPSWFKK